MSALRFTRVFLAAAALISAAFVVRAVLILGAASERLVAPHQPLGGDFINLHAVGQLLLAGRLDDIYDPEDLMAFEHTIIDASIGLRLWAYPPHSLLVSWPFGFGSYETAFALWSLLGVLALLFAARRYGLGWFEAVLLAFSPAAVTCVLLGQTGNLMTAMLLLALSARSNRDAVSISGTLLLTLKPQMGLLVPLVWLLRRRWGLIAWTSAGLVALLGLSLVVFGTDVWAAYLSETVPLLTRLEKGGTGPFMLMIPSLFMSGRLFGLDGDTALVVHLVFAAAVFALLVWRLLRTASPRRQDALVLVGIALISPYLHLYDLAIVSAAVLMLLREAPETTGWRAGARQLVLTLVWLLPILLMPMNAAGLPLSPLLLFALFVLI